MKDNRWTKRCTEWQPSRGKRSRGRQSRRWQDNITKKEGITWKKGIRQRTIEGIDGELHPAMDGQRPSNFILVTIDMTVIHFTFKHSLTSYNYVSYVSFLTFSCSFNVFHLQQFDRTLNTNTKPTNVHKAQFVFCQGFIFAVRARASWSCVSTM